MTTAIISPWPKFQAFDSNGDPLVGGLLYTYAAGSTTPLTTYTSSTAGTPNANPVVLNSRGEADVWLQSLPYKFVLTAAGGDPMSPIWSVDNILGGSPSTVGTSSVFANVAAAIAATIPASTTQLLIAGYTTPGDAGELMVYKSTNTASGPGIITSADGAHWILTNNPTNWVMFGADKTGAVAADTAINLWISWANALATSTQGVSSVQPDGTYKITTQLSNITGSGIWIQGASIDGLTLNLSSTTGTFKWSGNAFGGGIRNATLAYPAAPANTASAIIISGAGRQSFLDLVVRNCNTLATLGTDVSHTCAYVTFRNILGYVYNSGKPTFDVAYGDGFNLNGVSMYVDGVAVPTSNRTSTMTTVAGTNFIEFSKGAWDTSIIEGNTQSNRYYHALYINAPLAIVSNIFVDETVIFDFNSNDAISITAPTGASGAVVTSIIHSGYIYSWSGHGIALYGDNSNKLHDFSGAKVIGAGKDGVHIEGAATANLVFDDMTTIACNRLDGGYCNINIAAGTHDFSMNGGDHLGGLAGLTPAWAGDYMVKMGADCYNFSITGGVFGADGQIGVFSLADNTTASGFRWISQNVNADYDGAKSSGMFTVPSTGATWQNKSPFRVQVNFYGLDGLAVNGQDSMGSPAAGAGYGSFELMPGEAYTPTYTLAHSITYYVHV